VSADNLNHVLSRFLCGVRILRREAEVVVFDEFRYEAVDRTTDSREAVKNLRALLVVIPSLKYRLELADCFPGFIHQMQFVSRAG